MDWLSPEILASYLTLTVLEIVLGIDNLVFLSVISQKLPAERQPAARRVGLLLALGLRIALLFTLAWLAGLTTPLFEMAGLEISTRDLVLVLGGLFLLYKATREIHDEVEGTDHEGGVGARAGATFLSVIAQIAVIDLVFSIDSVLTAVGMADHIEVMVAAIVTAIVVMLVAAEPTSRFIETHPTVKMLALSFLLLIGVALVADGLHFHVPRGYLYFAIAFSMGVEALNQLRDRRRPAGSH